MRAVVGIGGLYLTLRLPDLRSAAAEPRRGRDVREDDDRFDVILYHYSKSVGLCDVCRQPFLVSGGCFSPVENVVHDRRNLSTDFDRVRARRAFSHRRHQLV